MRHKNHILKFIFSCPLLLMLFHAIQLTAQESFSYKFKDNWTVGLNAGSTLQLGELSGFGGNGKTLGTATSIFMGKQVLPWLSLRGNLISGTFKGQDLFTYSKAKFYSYQLIGIFSIPTVFRGYDVHRKIDLYALTGTGLIDFQSDVWDNNTQEWLGGFGHGYGKGIKGYTREWIFPTGLGFMWNFYGGFNLNLETIYYFIGTDKLDATDVFTGKDRGLYSSLGFSYRFNLGRIKHFEPLNYQTSADKISYKYKNLSFQQGKSRQLRDGAKPMLAVEIPAKIGVVDSFNIVLKLRNDGVSGVADIDVVIPQGFTVKLPKSPGLISESADLVGNIYTTLPPSDTSLQMVLTVFSGQAPVGSHPFYIGYKVIDAAGETTGDKKLYYVEKDLMYSPDGGRPLADRMMGVEFRVQLTASPARIPMDKLAQLYPIKEKIFEDFSDGFYQYTAGSFKTSQEADKFKEKLSNELGINDLYVVFFQNGTRISSFKGAETGPSYWRVNEPTRREKLVTQTESRPQRAEEYRVEIRKSEGIRLKTNELQALFETPEPITEVYHEGVYYYFAGRFVKEEIAQAYREYISDRYGIVSARVVPFSRGRLVVKN
ncbi:MAG: hypothetical protein ACP5O2_03570 [Bacteroidales bacterium]